MLAADSQFAFPFRLFANFQYVKPHLKEHQTGAE